MPIPSKSPEILFDIDGTCLDSAGKFNTNLFKAMKTMGIDKVNFLTSFEMRKLEVQMEEKSFRCLVIDELKKTGIKTGYVIVNASPYLDFDANNRGKLGTYYRTVIEKFERRILNFRRKNPDAMEIAANEKDKMRSDKDREQNLLRVEATQREIAARAAEEKRRATLSRDEIVENPPLETQNPTEIEKQIASIQEKLQPHADCFPESEQRKYIGGKERMILHIVHHSDLADNFVVFDDKQEVINMAQRMATDDENYPQVYGRIHAVSVNMKDRKQTEDYFIRKLIQGYSINQLKQFVKAHGNELNDSKQDLLNLLNAIPEEQQLNEKHKGIYAQLVLACWHPQDIDNIVELYAKLSEDDELPEGLKLLVSKIMDLSLDNPVARGKVLDAIIGNLNNNKTPLGYPEIINQIKDKTLEHFSWATEDYDWTTLEQSISANNCNTPMGLLHLQSGIQLGLAIEGSQDTDDLIRLMTRVEGARKSRKLFSALIKTYRDEKNPFNDEEQERYEEERYEQEDLLLETSKENISKAIAATAANPQKFLELLRYYREASVGSPQKEVLTTYLTPDKVQPIVETLTSLNPPQPWKFIGYPTLKGMLSKLKNEGELLNYVNFLEQNYPEGSPAIASLMISLIAGYTHIDFYPADTKLPQIGKVDTSQHELNLLLELSKQNPDAIDKIKEKFIDNSDLGSWLFLIKRIGGNRALSGSFVPSLMLAIDGYNQEVGHFENYHIDYKAKEVLKRLTSKELKTAVAKHAALCALSELPEAFTQEEAEKFISRLNDSVNNISEQGDSAATNYVKESAITVTLNILGRIKGDNAYLLSIDDFNVDLSNEAKDEKIKSALKNRGLAESAFLFIKNSKGEIFYYAPNSGYTEQLDHIKLGALDLNAVQKTLNPGQFEKFRDLSPDVEFKLLDPDLQNNFEELLASYLSSSMACYSFLKKSLNKAFIQQDILEKIARGHVIEALEKNVDPALKEYIPQQEAQDKPGIKEALQVIAYADHISRTQKNSLDALVILTNEISNLSVKKDEQFEGLVTKARDIQRAAFENYLNNLTYSKQTEEEIMNLPYFQQNKAANNELLAVLEAAQTVLSDVTRLPSTKTEVLKSLARTAQACVQPTDQNNRKKLQEMGQQFKLKPDLKLLGKAILMLLSTVLAGIGFLVSAAVVVKQTRNDMQFFRALNKPNFNPEIEKEDETKKASQEDGEVPSIK
ncbi:hypothetical protein [Legionella sp.]|uniref:hypothetical protein n=1 Tax=Legionella sp. TaxID=459 RepID=UPI000CC6D515|nr:hypothetical protein [Legionella sp.]PJE07032.1 MAG: hypothetical protein CK430_14440 [Legionella sp.]